MDIQTKVLLVRIGAGIALIGVAMLGWWMDYLWKYGPQGRGFYKANGQTMWEKYDPSRD